MAQVGYVSEKEARTFYVTTDVDTTGQTVGIYAVGPDETANLVGSTAGVAADTQMSIVSDWTPTATLTVDTWYKLECVGDVSETNPTAIWPDEDDEDYLIYLRGLASVT